MIAHYRQVFQCIRFCPESGYEFSGHGDPGRHAIATYMAKSDSNLSGHYVASWKFLNDSITRPKDFRPRCYYIPKDFCEALGSIDGEIPVDLIPDFFGYFSFADKSVFDESESIQGAFIYVGPGANTPLTRDFQGVQKVLWISYVGDFLNNDSLTLPIGDNGFTIPGEMPNVGRLLCELEQKKIDDIAASVPTINNYLNTPKQIDERLRNQVFRVLINAVLYVSSLGADLVRAPVKTGLSNRLQKEYVNQHGYLNEVSIPLVLVSWNYKKPTVYGIDSTWVNTYRRWYRCGPNSSQIKLVWVKDHRRHYTNTSKSS
jgi:hypothetical protein